MNNNIIRGLFLLIFCVIICKVSFLASYQDDFTRLEDSSAQSYNNLANSSTGLGYATFKNQNTTKAWVEYSVQNCETISVSVLSSTGSRVGVSSLGHITTEMNTDCIVVDKYTPYISHSTNGIYVNTSEGPHMLTYHHNVGYAFQPADMIPKDLEPYTIKVGYSSDNNNYHWVTGKRTVIGENKASGLIQEDWLFQIPKSAKKIKVEINDVTTIVATQGNRIYTKHPSTRTHLISVVLQGEGLMLGVDEPIVPNIEQKPVEEKPAKDTKYVSSAEEYNVKAEKPTTDATKQEKPNTSTVKSKTATPKAKENEAVEQSIEEGQQEETPLDEPLVYFQPAKGKQVDKFETIMVVYIIIVGGLVVVMVVNPTKKK